MKSIKIMSLGIILIGILLFTLLGTERILFAASSENVVIQSDFENNLISPWKKKGSETLKLSSEVAHGGKTSLLVTGRTQFWEGPEVDLTGKLVKGEKYTVSAWVYQASDKPHEIRITAYNLDSSSSNPYDGKFYTCVAKDGAVASGKWVQLKGEFTFNYSGEYKQSTLYIESPDTGYDFYVDDICINGVVQKTAVKSIEMDLPSLCPVYQADFPIGVAVPSSVFDDPVMTALIKKHFNSITSEWEMKSRHIWKSKTEYDFAASDRYVKFITDNKMRLRGHALIWHIDQPDWIFKDPDNPAKDASRELLIQRMKTYISTVVGRYKGKIQCWDVVNEAIDTTQPNNLRVTPWLKIIGPEYIELAFKFAYEADPETKLFYNDYDTENSVKRQAIYDLVKRLKEKGVPVDGIGCQGHISLNQPTIDQIEQTIKTFADLGVEVEITELDVSVFNSAGLSREVLIDQGYRYGQLMQLFKKYHQVVSGVTFWGLKDDMSWLVKEKTDAPLVFDKDFKAKYAFWGMVDITKLPVAVKTYEAANASPVIDGKPELAWDILKAEQVKASDGKAVGSFKSTYNDKNLFFLIQINAPVQVDRTSVEIFIDAKNHKENKFAQDDQTYKFDLSGKKRIKKVDVGISQNQEGYLLEVAVPFNFKTLNKDKVMGFDIRFNCESASVSWNDPVNSQDKQTANYGTLKLGKGPEYVEAIQGTPEIDGEPEKLWKQAKVIRTRVINGNSDVSKGEFRVLWDSQYLYVYGEIKDSLLSSKSSNPWEQDSVEFFIDQDFARSPVYEGDDGQYRVNYQNEKTVAGNAVLAGFKTITKKIAGGYAVEAAIPLNKVPGRKGNLIGFDIQVNDDNGQGIRVGQSNWSDLTGTGWQTTAVFGVVRLN